MVFRKLNYIPLLLQGSDEYNTNSNLISALTTRVTTLEDINKNWILIGSVTGVNDNISFPSSYKELNILAQYGKNVLPFFLTKLYVSSITDYSQPILGFSSANKDSYFQLYLTSTYVRLVTAEYEGVFVGPSSALIVYYR